MRKIYAYTNDGECQVKDFFNRAEEKAVDKLMFQLEIIRDERNGFLEPHIKHFSIERYRRLYEFRFRQWEAEPRAPCGVYFPVVCVKEPLGIRQYSEEPFPCLRKNILPHGP